MKFCEEHHQPITCTPFVNFSLKEAHSKAKDKRQTANYAPFIHINIFIHHFLCASWLRIPFLHYSHIVEYVHHFTKNYTISSIIFDIQTMCAYLLHKLNYDTILRISLMCPSKRHLATL